MNIYYDVSNEPHWKGKVYSSKEEAKENARFDDVANIKIEWEE